MEGARPHLDVIRLQDQAALGRPEILQRQDKVLKGRCLGHDSAPVWEWPEPIGGPREGKRRAAAQHGFGFGV